MTALADRVKESTTTTGTGSLTLSGAVAQFESFNTAFGTAAPFYYVITDANGTDWEVGTGELSNATTLVRTTVHQSSNADAKINLSAGTHTVFCSAPAVFLADLASKSGKLSQFAATTSAELAGVVSDETGSGALVFATSPTLTTPNIGVATATSVNGTTIPASKTLVVTTDKLSALAATTSAELAGVISDETGTGSLVFASSPSLTTPDIGAATATSVNGTTIPSSKTLVVTTDKLSALAATTSAELAGVISDETGSGSLVFATSPSLTTPNIGTPSAGTLTNCTGLPVGGVSGLGTGVGTALAVNTGSAGAFVVNGGALGTPSSGTLTNATGLPVSTGVSGLGTGVATALAVNTGSSGAFVVNGGALGTPSSGTVTNLTGTASININGTVGATTANTGAFTTLSATGNVNFDGGTFVFNESGADKDFRVEGDTDANLLFTDASTDRVGIGTSAPGAKLDVRGANVAVGQSDGFVQFRTTTTQAADVGAALQLGGLYDASNYLGFGEIAGRKENSTSGNWSGYLQFATREYGGSFAERMRITSAGNVGIGTSSPYSTARLQVKTGTNKNFAVQTGTTDTSGIKLNVYNDAADTNIPIEINGSVFIAKTGETERMRIDSSGNVLVGASSSVSFGGVTPNFQVTNTSFTGSDVDGGTIATFGSSSYGLDKGSGVVFGFKYNTAGNYVTAARVRGAKENGTDGNYAGYLGFDTRANGGNLTERMRIDSSGNLTCAGVYSATVGATNRDVYVDSGGLIGYVSSIRASKTNIADIANVSWLYQLNPVSYQYRKKDEAGNYTDEADGPIDFGLIAEDTELIKPELCFYDEVDGKQELRGISYSKLIVPMLKAIQEQQQQIDALKAEVAALKGNA